MPTRDVQPSEEQQVLPMPCWDLQHDPRDGILHSLQAWHDHQSIRCQLHEGLCQGGKDQAGYTDRPLLKQGMGGTGGL